MVRAAENLRLERDRHRDRTFTGTPVALTQYFVVFLSFSIKMLEYYSRLFANCFHIFTHKSSDHRRYVL
jgi:hypothetical protein